MSATNAIYDRILVIKPMDGVNAKSTSGVLDNRLFTGENKLHAKMEGQTCLWTMNYDSGIPPAPLRQQFTSFRELMKFATEYFKRRNIEIKEVID